MRKGVIGLAAMLLIAGTLAAAPCTPSPTTLCLNASRFQVEVSWRDSRARTGVGQAVPITADTGYFWFFSEANIELVIKVLDARSINGKYWVFFGALSNVEYTLRVTDTVTGATKDYFNPLGQFASVGDTGAFEPTPGAVAVHESVGADGAPVPPESFEAVQRFIDAAPAPSAFTPCPETVFGFNLSGCRFHLEVHWRDSRGRTGDGQPVQLTNDTGYFWFFSPANVELMVKVLDARAVNGQFWVFFGALSNVEYSLTVTDTVTGVVKSYRNPASTFASVGDTGAFRAGYSVSAVRDGGRSASVYVNPVTGGTVTATASDGTVFHLTIPAQALLSPETVTMTPVSRLDRIPFSGGFVAGVELEPEGLNLLAPATLTIEPATPLPADHTLPYAYRRGGEEFIIYLRTDDSSTLTIPVFHFSGYGAGSGSMADLGEARTPGGALDFYVQQVSILRLRLFYNDITLEQYGDYVVGLFEDAFNFVIKPLFDEAKQACDTDSIDDARAKIELACQTGFTFLHTIQTSGFEENLRLEFMTPAIFDLALEILRACQAKAYERCVAWNDPFQATLMLYIAQELQVFGETDPYLTTFIEDGVLESCLRFELDFESKVVLEVSYPGGSAATRLKYRSQHVPLRLSFGNPHGHSGAWEGGCTLLPEVATLELPHQTADCHVVVAPPGNGRFNAAAAWIGVMDDPTRSAVKLLYNPGSPEVTASLLCDGRTTPFPVFQFPAQYRILHENEATKDGLFFAKDWRQLRFGSGPSQNGEFFAKKSYERTIQTLPDQTLTEETWFFLKHTPNAPMPDCP